MVCAGCTAVADAADMRSQLPPPSAVQSTPSGAGPEESAARNELPASNCAHSSAPAQAARFFTAAMAPPYGVEIVTTFATLRYGGKAGSCAATRLSAHRIIKPPI